MAQTRFWGKFLRGWGASFEGIGKAMQGDLAYTETMGKHRTVTSFQATAPSVASAFVAPCASIIGDVQAAAGSSVWYGAVLRGDVNTIKVGSNTSIGDRAVVHVASEAGSVTGKPAETIIGDDVQVGALAILHACNIGKGASIGTAAQVLDGATVGVGAVIEAASVVPPGKAIPTREVWGGVPAKFIRKVSDDEVASMERAAVEISDLAKVHATEAGKSWEELEADKEAAYDRKIRDPDYNSEYYPEYKPKVKV
jgi:carbonic anhydrase/acetyltransferase-like protein (isoleucine patch superfamily)